MKESNHKLLGNFSATFENLGTFCDFRQLLLVKFSASFDLTKFSKVAPKLDLKTCFS